MQIPGFSAIVRASQGNEYSSPKTVLGFYAGLLVILEIGVAVVLGFLLSQSDLHYLVPWVLGFGALVFVAIIAVVVAMNVMDPSKLQLGEMTGREFIDYQRVTRGDSIGGEYVEASPKDRTVLPGVTQILPPAVEDEEEEGSVDDKSLPRGEDTRKGSGHE